MITISMVFNLIGVSIFYLLSKKDDVNRLVTIPEQIFKYVKAFKAIGIILFCLSLFFCGFSFGTISGLIFWFFSILSLLSIVIIVFPLEIINYKFIGILSFLCLILEIVIS